MRNLMTLLLLIFAAGQAHAQCGPVYRTVPQGCSVHGNGAGPVYDQRGFYQGYYQPIPIAGPQPVFSQNPAAVSLPQPVLPSASFSTGVPSNFNTPGYVQGAAGYFPAYTHGYYNTGFYSNGFVPSNTYTPMPGYSSNTSGYSPTLPFVPTAPVQPSFHSHGRCR